MFLTSRIRMTRHAAWNISAVLGEGLREAAQRKERGDPLVDRANIFMLK